VRTKLHDFLGDFANKLSLQSATDDIMDDDQDLEELQVLVNQQHTKTLRALLPNKVDGLDWDVDDRFPDFHTVSFIRHVQGMVPWEIPTLGTPANFIEGVIDSGDAQTIPGILASIPEIKTKIVMGIVALSRLTDTDETVDLDLCRAVLHALSSGRKDKGASVDGALFVSVEDAHRIVHVLNEEDHIRELIAMLYCCSIDESAEDLLLEAMRRTQLLMAASQGQADWALRAFNGCPLGWRHPLVFECIKAEMAYFYLAEQRHDYALNACTHIKAATLRASTVLKAAVVLAEQRNSEGAARAKSMARILSLDGHEPLPPEYNAPQLENSEAGARRVCAHFQPGPELTVMLLSVLGTRAYRPVAGDGDDWRASVLIDASGGNPVELLRQIGEYPDDTLDSTLVTAIRAVARGYVVADGAGASGKGGAP